MNFEYLPRGPFDLSNQSKYFGGWPSLPDHPSTCVLVFPVEGWQASAAVTLTQDSDGRLVGTVHGPAALHEKAWSQALASLSLDIDAWLWPDVGRRDPVMRGLQAKYLALRPVLFYSPYEAAAGFIIGHRITIKQKQVILQAMADQVGDPVEVAGQSFRAFPRPQTLLQLDSFQSLSGQKIERLHGVAQAALDGLLDRDRLRALPMTEALVQLQRLPGIGPFFAEGILFRAAGIVDDLTKDDLTQYAVQRAYDLSQPPDEARLQEISDKWRPYRMWAEVLLHVWLRREVGLPSRRTFKRG